MNLDKETLRRFSRNIMLPEIREDGQKKLFGSSVLCIGCGALGSISAMYLVASGVGKIGLVDFDTVDISNLQRQLSYSENDVGKKKTDVLAGKLKGIYNMATIVSHDVFLRKEQARELITGYDFILEGSDNPETKHMVSHICRELKKPCVIGGISGVTGQVLTYIPGSASYCDFFPVASSTGGFTPCSLGGVLGPLPGIIGSIEATETIKYLTGFGELLINRILIVDASTMTFQTVSI